MEKEFEAGENKSLIGTPQNLSRDKKMENDSSLVNRSPLNTEIKQTSLTSKQQHELNLAIADYFKRIGCTESLRHFLIESNMKEEDMLSTRYNQLLEKKWTSVIRLQRKVMELEDKLKRVPTGISAALNGEPNIKKNVSNKLPRFMKHRLIGHRGVVNSVAFNPIFSILASSSDDNTVKIWDWERGILEKTLRGHVKAVTACAFDFSEGRYLVSASADSSIKIWDMKADFKCVKTLNGHENTVSHVIPSPDFRYIYSCSRDETIKRWEVDTGYCQITYFGHQSWVRMVDCSEDGALLVSCSNDNSIRIWNSESGECKNEIKNAHEHVIECCKFVPLEANTYTIKNYIVDAKTSISSLTEQSRRCSYIVSGSRDKTIKLWNWQSGQCLYSFEAHDNWVRDLGWLESSATETNLDDELRNIMLVSASDDGQIKIWDLRNRRAAKTLDGAQIKTSKDGSTPVKTPVKLNSGTFINKVDICRAGGILGGNAVMASCGTDMAIRIWSSNNR